MFNLTLRHNFHTDELGEMNVFLLNKGFLFSGELFREGHHGQLGLKAMDGCDPDQLIVRLYLNISHIGRYVLP